MIARYTQEEYDKAGHLDKLPLECRDCQGIFYVKKKSINWAIKHKDTKGVSKYELCRKHGKNKYSTIEVTCTNCKKVFRKWPSQLKFKDSYCSKVCRINYKKMQQDLKIGKGYVNLICELCGKEYTIRKNAAKSRAKRSKHSFCSSKCSLVHVHKQNHNSRSKLELWLEKTLSNLYPNLEILFNNKLVIGSELDIYIPSLKLAFELNGRVHYEPIFGNDKLDKTKNNDNRKMIACYENGISLAVIDTTSQKYFKESTSKQFLDLIISIINDKLQA